MTTLPPSLQRLLERRGFRTQSAIDDLRAPSLSSLTPTDHFPDMERAVARLRAAIESEEPIGIYADRDVDGLSGLAILARSLRSLGGIYHWGSPLGGRGLQRAVLESILSHGVKLLVLVDCGTGEREELTWLAAQGVDVIVADHHRLGAEPPPAFAWIHPQATTEAHSEVPAGCVMAFQLARGLWQSYAGDDAGRLDYFLFSQLDLLCLGILADQVPLLGDNRTLVWHGLRRLAQTRKAGLASLMRFFRLLPRTGPVTVREASWQIIPLLNAAGRLGEPQWTVDLLTTEDPFTARRCLDRLLELNGERRSAQDESLRQFTRSVREQCSLESDAVIIACADDLEPSVTGLAAQAFARQYGKPTFLFVRQGSETIGSGRGIAGVDLFEWVEEHADLLVKFGGHEGAVGLTVRSDDFPALRERLMATGRRRAAPSAAVVAPESDVDLAELDADWWSAYQTLEPFGKGFDAPLFSMSGVVEIARLQPRASKSVVLRDGARAVHAECETHLPIGPGPWILTGTPRPPRHRDYAFTWTVQEVRRGD